MKNSDSMRINRNENDTHWLLKGVHLNTPHIAQWKSLLRSFVLCFYLVFFFEYI